VRRPAGRIVELCVATEFVFTCFGNWVNIQGIPLKIPRNIETEPQILEVWR
jgi:hypothetical protein